MQNPNINNDKATASKALKIIDLREDWFLGKRIYVAIIEEAVITIKGN